MSFALKNYSYSGLYFRIIFEQTLLMFKLFCFLFYETLSLGRDLCAPISEFSINLINFNPLFLTFQSWESLKYLLSILCSKFFAVSILCVRDPNADFNSIITILTSSESLLFHPIPLYLACSLSSQNVCSLNLSFLFFRVLRET